jgi:hypothetical protein
MSCRRIDCLMDLHRQRYWIVLGLAEGKLSCNVSLSPQAEATAVYLIALVVTSPAFTPYFAFLLLLHSR